MEWCASLGTRATATKQLGSIPETKEKDPKATRKKMELNRSWTGSPRRPRAHGPPIPRAHGLLRELMLEHPVRTGLYRAHGTPVCTGPTYPVCTGPTGWTANIAVWPSYSPTLSPCLYNPYLGSCLGVSEDIYEIFVSFAPSATPLEIKAS